MIKLIIQSPGLFKKLSSIPVLKRIIFFDFSRLNQVKDEELFFKAITQLRMLNGIYKKTNSQRFNDIDNALADILGKGQVYQIHDVAVSDGITSVDLYNNLTAKGIQFRLDISDKFASVFRQQHWYGAAYKDADGNVLYNDFLKIQAYRYTSPAYIISKWLGYFFPVKSPVRSSDSEIIMLNPATTALIKKGEITFSYFDIFEKGANNKMYDAVRCMNVLNYKVFPDEAIKAGVLNLISTVKDGGLFILGRTQTQTGINDVSLFRKKAGKLELLLDIGNGSEVKFLLDDIIL